ncbi:hypothetical protein K503DRAFT_870448, partial [Rhizopogon vinicolor AM-OR11-026]
MNLNGKHSRDNNAYAWDIHITLKQSGHEDLLSIADVAGKKPSMNICDVSVVTLFNGHNVILERSYSTSTSSATRACPSTTRLFNGAQDNVHSSNTHCSLALSSSLTSRPHKLLGHFSSLFYLPQPTIGESKELQQTQGQHMTSHPGPRAAEVAPVWDKQALYLAPRQETVSERVKCIKNPAWWTCRVVFICGVTCICSQTRHQQSSIEWSLFISLSSVRVLLILLS